MTFLIIQIGMTCLGLQIVIQLLGRLSKQRFVLALLLTVALLLQYHFYILANQQLLERSVFFLSYLPLLLLFGPLMRLYFKLISNDDYRIKLSNCLHLLLPLIGLYYYFSYQLLPLPELRSVINGLYEGGAMGLFRNLSLLCGLSLLSYAVLILKEQPQFYRPDKLLNGPVLLGWAIINMVLVLALTISIFSSSFSIEAMHLGNVIVSLVFIGIFLVNHRYPNLFKQWLFEVRKSQRSRQYLGDLDPNKLLAKIEHAMKEQALYADPDLSLQGLAEQFDLSRYQLSELLNDYATVSFHDFVARYRIEAAKQLLASDTWKKVISVAFEVGFNSQATFNKSFKKYTGMTPSEFQKKGTTK